MQAYTVQKGDTLSGIAKRHGHADWRPLHNYNTKVHKRLRSGDPNLIHPGEQLVIPRSKKAYDEAIEHLEKMRVVVKQEAHDLKAEMDATKKDTDAHGAKLDLVSDVLTITVVAGLRCAKLAGMVRKAMVGKALFKVAQKTVVTLSGHWGSTTDDLVVKETANAVSDQAIMAAKVGLNPGKFADKFAVNMAKDLTTKGTKTVAENVAKMTGNLERSHGIVEIVGLVTDLALKGLDGLKPSSLSKLAVWSIEGTHPDDAHANAQRQIAHGTQQSIARLADTIARLADERAKVYP